jgi:hypothetical protein
LARKLLAGTQAGSTMNIFSDEYAEPFSGLRSGARGISPSSRTQSRPLEIFDYDGVKRTMTDYEALQFQPGEGK